MATQRLEGFLYVTGRKIVAWMNDAAALLNEGRTDHAATKVTLDQIETLVEELAVDHATTKVTVDQLETLAEELGTDHATTKVTVDQLETLAEELGVDHTPTLNALDAAITPDGVVGGSFVLSATSAATIAATGNIQYRIGGVVFFATMPATIALEDLGDITQSNFGAWRILIDKLGACTAQASPTIGGRATAQIALLELAGLAPTANTATIGYLTVTDSNSVFNPATDNLDASGVTVVFYHVRGPAKRISGLNAALGAASTLTAASTTFGHGTIDANMNGLKKAQIAAGATQALTDADTITTLKWGATVVCTDLAGTGKVSLNAAGTPGATLMAYNSAALARAAIDLVVDRLPPMFVPIILIEVNNQIAGTFTYKTTNWDAAGATSTITDAGVLGWNRAVPLGFNSNQLTAPTVPAVLAASVAITSGPATLSAATAITSGPATLSASGAITSGPAALSAAAVDDFTFPDGAP